MKERNGDIHDRSRPAARSPRRFAAHAGSLLIADVSKQFREAGGSSMLALDGLSLSVAAGEMVSLIGPSGCGKSTLLRLIAGLDQPSSGELSVGGEPIKGPSAQRGLVFQDPNLFPWLSVRRNIQVGLVARGVLGRHRAKVDEYLNLVGLQAFADAHPHQLSGGMAQRAALARALINDPKVLLLDELPGKRLTSLTGCGCKTRFWRIWQSRETTMVLVTHDIDERHLHERLGLVVMTCAAPAGSSARSTLVWIALEIAAARTFSSSAP